MRNKFLSATLLLLLSAQQAFALEHNFRIVAKKDVGHFIIRSIIDHRRENRQMNRELYDIGLQYPFSNGWSIAANYRILNKKSDSDWNTEKRPYVDLKKKFNLDLVNFSVRTRQEYRIREGKNDSWRNRIQFAIKSNKEFVKTTPYIENESFYNFDSKKYDKNRVTAGIYLPKLYNIKPKLGYRLTSDKQDDGKWETKPSLIIGFGIRF